MLLSPEAPIYNPPNLSTPRVTDRITQTDEPMVDILWVIDNSGSMAEEQDAIASNIDAFLAWFLASGTDWHMGVISTDTDDASSGVLVQSGGHRFVSREVVGSDAVFANMVASLGTSGSASERGLRAVSRFFDKMNGPNTGFYREDASFHVIIVSDEDDQSGADPTVSEFVEMMVNLKAGEREVTFSSIVWPTSGCSGGVYAGTTGTRYIMSTNQIGGLHEPICQDDWIPLLEQLGLQAAGSTEYYLSEVPVEGTLRVWVELPPTTDGAAGDTGVVPQVHEGVDLAALGEGQTVADACRADVCFGYVYDPVRNSVAMEGYTPPALAVVNLEYDLLREHQPETEF